MSNNILDVFLPQLWMERWKSYPYSLYPDYAFCDRLPWSKNVVEEQDAHHQVLFASMDTRYDVHSNLGLWPEYHYELNTGHNNFVYAYSGLDDPVCIKERMSRLLADSHSDDNFVLDRPGLLELTLFGSLPSLLPVEIDAQR